MNRQEAPPPGPTSHYFYSNRLKLHYLDWGNHGAPPLLLVHGGMDHCRSWDWMAQELRRDYHVVTPDLRGHGDSDWINSGNYALFDFVPDLMRLVRVLGWSELNVVGHSYGGIVSLLSAAVFPKMFRRVIALDSILKATTPEKEAPVAAAPDRIATWIEQIRIAEGKRLRTYPSLEDAITRLHQSNPQLSIEQARHLTTYAALQNADGSYRWKYDQFFKLQHPVELPIEACRELWPRVSAPVLYLAAGDSWIDKDAVADALGSFPNARMIRMEGVGHWLHHDRFDEVMAHIRSFLAA